jgi:hypothetical protein
VIVRDDLDSERRQIDAKRLLGRGGRIFGLAAVAHANGRRAGEGDWNVLCPQITTAAEEVLLHLEGGVDVELLEGVVSAALGDVPAVASPAWALPLVRDPGLLSRVGTAFEEDDLRSALGPDLSNPSGRDKGLAALAVGFAHSRDSLRALVVDFSSEDRAIVLRMACLASVTVVPKEPSRIRNKIKQIVKQADRG